MNVEYGSAHNILNQIKDTIPQQLDKNGQPLPEEGGEADSQTETEVQNNKIPWKTKIISVD